MNSLAIIKEIQRYYYYNIDIEFLLDKETIPIDFSELNIDNDYENAFNPTAYIRAQLDENVYTKMQNNRNKGRLVVTVNTYNTESTVQKKYFKKIFMYEFPTTGLDEVNKETNDESDNKAYRQTYIGLIDIDAINRNKMIINNLFVNTNMSTMIHQYLTQDIIREPFDNNPDFDHFFIPPIEGIPEFLRYMNSRSSFYNTGFRYFDGYKCAYLLSNKGIPIDSKDNDNSFSTFYITISSAAANPSQNTIIDGFMENINRKCYYIDVLSSVVKFYENTVQDKLFNQIYMIGYDGKTVKRNIDVNHVDESKTKPKIIRTFDSNFNFINTLKNQLEITSQSLMMTCKCLDNSIVDPSKEYILTFSGQYQDRSGKYLLTRKGEQYAKKGEQYICNTVLHFKKVSNN